MKTYIKKWIAWLYDYYKIMVFKRKTQKLYFNIKRSHSQEDLNCTETKRITNIFTDIKEKPYSKSTCIYSLISGLKSDYYIPEHIYYTLLEPVLNDKAFTKAYTDKNFYDRLLDKELLPDIYFRSIKGVLYDADYNPLNYNEIDRIVDDNKKFVLKIAVDSGGGKGVGIYSRKDQWFQSEINDSHIQSLKDLLLPYGKDFVCQQWIQNHPYYEDFNPSSLNTVRMLIYRSVQDEKNHLLHTILRVGKEGSIVDNQASGGFACGVTNTGELRGFCVQKDGSKHQKVNQKQVNKGQKIFAFEAMRQKAFEVARYFPHARLLGLDLCLDEKGQVKLIEVNCVNNEINFYQMCNGPLFGDFTNEILKWVPSQKKSYCFDFYL